MSNYTIENLIPATIGEGRIPAIRIGSLVFPMQMAGASAGTDFYKCASVDTANHTWTGYKAVLSSGIYSYESTATTGLTYSVITPEVGKVYADGALVKADLYTGIPANGLVLYIPFDGPAGAAETEQALSFNGSGFAYSTVNGIPCCSFSGGGYVDVGTDDLPTGNLTVSYWVKFTGSDWGIIYTQPGMHTGADSTSLSFGNYTEWGVGATANTANWHHFAVTRDNDAIKVYLDGVNPPGSADTKPLSITNSACRIGGHNDNPEWYPFVGYLAGLRVYNRALSASEIAALAAEFTPSAGA